MLYRESAIRKLQSAETDNRLCVNIPLIVAKDPSPQFRPDMFHRAKEDIERGITAPLQFVLIRLNQPGEPAGVSRANAFETRAVECRNVPHLSFVGRDRDAVAVTHAHVSHVHAKNPKELFAFGIREVGESINESCNLPVGVRRFAGAKALPEWTAQDGKNPDVRINGLLQEDYLELDGMFDSVAIVFADHRFRR